MNILITGANGQLGNEMRVLSAAYPSHSWFFTDVAELDITDRQAIRSFVAENGIEVIVNCAAYTNVDRAEEDEKTAYLLNATAAENLAVVAQEAKALLIHISTDYVFCGNGTQPYRESDTPDPKTAYGRTKLAGERLIQAACPSAVIIRTAWLYSSFGNNFVKTMLRLGKERETISVVNDQIGTPTYAADLARAIMAVVEEREKTLREQGARNKEQGLASLLVNEENGLCSFSDPSADGERSFSKAVSKNVFHFSNLGICSWYDFTCEIFRQAGIGCKVLPITSDQYPAKTPRPHYSVLDKQKIQDTFSIAIPQWEDSLAVCLRLMGEYSE